MIPQMNVVTAAHHSCRIPRALRASRPFDRREVGLTSPLPCPPASTSPGEGLPSGLLEGSCGRPKCRSLPNCQEVGACMPASYIPGTYYCRLEI